MLSLDNPGGGGFRLGYGAEYNFLDIIMIFHGLRQVIPARRSADGAKQRAYQRHALFDKPGGIGDRLAANCLGFENLTHSTPGGFLTPLAAYEGDRTILPLWPVKC